MTALMQDVMERVQTLPGRKQIEVWEMVSKLVNIISDEKKHDDELIAYVDNDLTDEERAVMAAARKEHREYPERSVSLEDFMAVRGIKEENLEKIRLVYS